MLEIRHERIREPQIPPPARTADGFPHESEILTSKHVCQLSDEAHSALNRAQEPFMRPFIRIEQANRQLCAAEMFVHNAANLSLSAISIVSSPIFQLCQAQTLELQRIESGFFLQEYLMRIYMT